MESLPKVSRRKLLYIGGTAFLATRKLNSEFFNQLSQKTVYPRRRVRDNFYSNESVDVQSFISPTPEPTCSMLQNLQTLDSCTKGQPQPPQGYNPTVNAQEHQKLSKSPDVTNMQDFLKFTGLGAVGDLIALGTVVAGILFAFRNKGEK